MTEIRIQKKKSILPYVLVGIAILGAVAYYMYTSNYETTSGNILSKNDLINVRENNSQVNAYLAFTLSDSPTMTIDHAYTNEALTKLANATEAMAKEVGFDISTSMDKVKVLAEKITKDPYAVTHSGDIRIAGDMITASLLSIQKAFFPSLTAEVAEVERAVVRINPQILTLDQKDNVNTFFKSAAELLQKMN
jgi:hypothetical protein